MEQTKLKMTQKEFDEFYEIEGITEETEVKPTPEKEMPVKQDTTPETKFEEWEIEADKKLEEELNWDEEIE